MAYTPHTWESGEVLTPAKLNTLTTAIGEIDMSYTPKTWSDGDILSAAEMNRMEQAVASGGGGGGIFVINATWLDSDHVTLDKTWTEIKNAISSGQIAVVINTDEQSAWCGFVFAVQRVDDYTVATIGDELTYHTNSPDGYPSYTFE